MKTYFTLCLLFLYTSLFSQYQLKKERLALDETLKIAVFEIKDNLFTHGQTFVWDNREFTLLKTDSQYTLKHPDTNTSYTAYNTPLPLIQIDAPNGIVNEPKRFASIDYADSAKTLNSYAGIEIRGSSSRYFAKESYDINFYTNYQKGLNRNVQLGNMRTDDDWILDALYNEPLRLRSHLSFALWKKIHTPSYLNKAPKAQSGIDTQHCEVFINGHYKGVYLLTEQVDRKLLQLAKEDQTGIRGELFQGSAYQGAVTFDSIPVVKNYLKSWGGHDIEYPYPNDTPWDNLCEFTDAIIQGDDDAFAKAVETQINLPNIIDYFLFINALRAPDNLGKNIYLARYDRGEPYFYIPWDLDGTFGTIFNGEELDVTTDFLDNGLLRKLLAKNPENFIGRFKARWKELRNNELETNALLKWQKKHYQKLITSGVYEREKIAWPSLDYGTQRIEYMNNWTQKRLQFLDTYIENITPKTD